MIIDYDGDANRFIIDAGPRDTDLIRRIPGARHKGGVWTTPAELAQYAAIKNILDFGEWTDAAEARALRLSKHFDRTQLAKEADKAIPGREHLYPFQAAGVKFLAVAEQALLADDMGTGKTVQTLTAIDQLDAYPALVVCPNSVKHNWAKEVQQWTDATPFVVDGSATQRRKTIEAAMDAKQPVVIINYESLRLHSRLAPYGNTVNTPAEAEAKELNTCTTWGAVVVDEAHKIKEPKSKQTRAVWGVSKGAKLRFALTGTPVLNNPDDLWAIMHFVAPDEWPSRSAFRNRYCDIAPAWHGGIVNDGIRPERLPELDIFLQPRMLRRTKEQVLPDLPPRIFTDRLVPMGGKQAKAYEQMVKHMMAEVDNGVLVATDPLSSLGRLRQLASATPVLDYLGGVVELTTPSNKLDTVKDILQDGGTPLVLYFDSRKLAELFQRELDVDYSVGMITGKQNAQQRQLAVDMFQAGDLDVLCIVLKAGAEGLTLTRASRLVMVQESWSMGEGKQAADRIHRIGQHADKVEIITLMSEGTVDEAVRAASEMKEQQLQSIVRDPEWVKRAMRGEA